MSRKDLFLLDNTGKLSENFRPPIVNTINFSWDGTTGGGHQSITGIGFKPTRLRFDAVEIGSTNMSMGEDDGTSPQCLYITNSGNYEFDPSDSVKIYEFGGGGQYLIGKISSFDVDGFTIVWNDTGAFAGTVRLMATATRI